MKKIIYSLITIAVTILFSSCNSSVEEGDRNTFTWKGVMYDGYSDNPLPNTMIYLEAENSRVLDETYEIVAEGETDENGVFSLTYKRINIGYDVLRLYCLDPRYNDFPVYVGDINTNFDKQVATIPYAKIVLKIEYDSDSLIIGASGLVDADRTRYDENLSESAQGKFLLFSENKSIVSEIKCAYLPTAVQSGSLTWGFSYFRSSSELKDANNGNTGNISNYRTELKGFPSIDTINIEL